MQDTITGCNGYIVQIKTYDPTAPKVLKCMQQAEYDAYMAEVYEQNHAGDEYAFGLMIVFFIIITGIIVWFIRSIK